MCCVLRHQAVVYNIREYLVHKTRYLYLVVIHTCKNFGHLCILMDTTRTTCIPTKRRIRILDSCAITPGTIDLIKIERISPTIHYSLGTLENFLD